MDTSEDSSERREDADYALWRNGDSTFVIEDKRTGHWQYFNDCQPMGYSNNIFLYHYPSGHVENPSPSIGFRSGHLSKDSLPDWLITEFEHIYEDGEMTPATDPRGDEDG